MHTKRIIPCLDVKNGRVVKGVNFINFKDAGDPAEVGAAYDRSGADELVFLILRLPPTRGLRRWRWYARLRSGCLFLLP